MSLSESAVRFIHQLPEGEESPERALKFQALVFQSKESHDARSLVVEIYRGAAAGDWAVVSLHDLSMLVYSLLMNPAVIAEVGEDVERLFRRSGVSGNLWIGWFWIRGMMPTRNASADKDGIENYTTLADCNIAKTLCSDLSAHA